MVMQVYAGGNLITTVLTQKLNADNEVAVVARDIEKISIVVALQQNRR